MSALAKLADTSPRAADLGLLVVRLWFGVALALGHGWGKLANLEAFTATVAKHGLPSPALLALLAALSEGLGGSLLALGLLTRGAALSVLGTMLVAAVVVHAPDPWMKKEFALCYAAAALALLISGAGSFSLDARLLGGRGRGP